MVLIHFQVLAEHTKMQMKSKYKGTLWWTYIEIDGNINVDNVTILHTRSCQYESDIKLKQSKKEQTSSARESGIP